MPKKVSADIAQTLKSIESGSQRLNQLATETSQRIIAFEDWLNRLPGKIATTYWYAFDDDHCYSYGLMLGRDGTRWSLWYEVANEQCGESEFTRLRDASLEIKLDVVSRFPAFLEHLTEAQAKLALEIEKTNLEFDQFAEAIGLVQVKGGE